MGAIHQLLASFSGDTPVTWTFIDSATSTTDACTVPGTAAAGDVALYFDRPSGFGLPTEVVPTGWTPVFRPFGNNSSRLNLSYKILAGGDVSASVTGMDGNLSDNKIIAVFRPSRPLTGVTFKSVSGEYSATAVAGQTIAASGEVKPVVAVAAYGPSDDPTSRSMSPSEDGEIDIGNTDVKYKIMNTGQTDLAITMPTDHGTVNLMASGYFTEGDPREITFVDSASSTGADITIPATAQAGDVAYYFDFGVQGAGPTAVTPTGFTNIYNAASSALRTMCSYKVLGGGDPGSTVTGMNATTNNQKLVLVFRCSDTAAVVNSTPSSEATASNPVAQTIETVAIPGIAFAAYGANVAVSPRSFTPAATAELDAGTRFYVKYRIFNTDFEAVTVDMDDEGQNALASFFSRL